MEPVFIPEEIARDDDHLESIRILNEQLAMALSRGSNDVTFWLGTLKHMLSLISSGTPPGSNVSVDVALTGLSLIGPALELSLDRRGLIVCDCPDCQPEGGTNDC